MSGYTKLFSSIVTSTIWREPDHVRLVWVTMLALSDRFGVVEASIPGLADMARVSRKDCEDALRVLADADPDSRTKEAGGRRIEATDGGWKLINHSKYREKMSDADRRSRRAEYMRTYRGRNEPSNPCDSTVTPCNSPSSPVTLVAHAEADSDQKQIRPKEKIRIPDSSEQLRSSEPAILVFPCVGNGEQGWDLTQSIVDAWSDAWPGVDVVAEAKKALVWLTANPAKRKTAKGMARFLTSWCDRAQNQGRGAKATTNARPGASGSVAAAREAATMNVLSDWLAKKETA